MARFRFCWIFTFLCWAMPAWAETNILKADHVSVDFIAPETFGRGDSKIALRFQLDPHWHIYWKNPGDSGTAPRFDIQSELATLGEVSWPIPKRIRLGDFTNIGYEGEVLFPLAVRPSDLAESVKIKARLEWLVCKEECLPGSGDLELTRPVASQAVWSGEDQAKIEASIKHLPSAQDLSPWSFLNISSGENHNVHLQLKHKDGKALSELKVFPLDGNAFKPQEPSLSADTQSIVLGLNPGISLPEAPSLLLVDASGAWEHKNVASFEAKAEAPSPLSAKASDHWSTFVILLLSAFAGGVILNLMPCVLPVLSIKFFSLAKMNRETRWQEILLYSLGVLVTFTALGGLFLALRAGGSAVGWGFQFQSPPIVMALILLFWLMGLSFLGLFEFGDAIVRSAGRFERSGAFATGVLSVFIATPCTGPFMGTALGAAATLPALEALTIFFFLGLGLASPFLALALFPSIRLPKPGMWMITLRQFLAFPLFATVIWLLWVLGLQLGTDAWLYVTILCLIFTFTIWLGKGRNRWVKAIAWVMALLATFVSVRWVVSAPLAGIKAPPSSQSVQWLDYDASIIAEAKGRQAVFVDFTAAWCVSCQVNKKAVLETQAAEALFARNHVKLIRADWTNLDQKITDALAEFERASVPLYLFYPADGSKPKILPQILTIADIEGLFP